MSILAALDARGAAIFLAIVGTTAIEAAAGYLTLTRREAGTKFGPRALVPLVGLGGLAFGLIYRGVLAIVR